MSAVLGVERREGETWRQCAERCANEAGGLGAEVLEEFDQQVAAGNDEEWDRLEFVEATS